MSITLEKGEIVVSAVDRDKGKVAKRSPKSLPDASINLILNKIFQAKRLKSHLYRRLGERELKWARELVSPSAGTGYYFRIKRIAVHGCERPTDRGYYFWMTTSTKRYRPDGSSYYLGNDDVQIVGLVINGQTVWRKDLRFILPEDPPPGFEDLYDSGPSFVDDE